VLPLPVILAAAIVTSNVARANTPK
jgi:hypothetical protein